MQRREFIKRATLLSAGTHSLTKAVQAEVSYAAESYDAVVIGGTPGE